MSSRRGYIPGGNSNPHGDNSCYCVLVEVIVLFVSGDALVVQEGKSTPPEVSRVGIIVVVVAEELTPCVCAAKVNEGTGLRSLYKMRHCTHGSQRENCRASLLKIQSVF
jgi:hypothetical protein